MAISSQLAAMKYQHRLKGKQINKAFYKPKDYYKEMELRDRCSINMALKGAEPMFKLASDLQKVSEYRKERALIESTFSDENKSRAIDLFNKYFEILDTGFIKTIVVREG